MKLLLQDSTEFEGAGKVTLLLRARDGPFKQSQCIELAYQGRRCAAIVDAVSKGEDRIRADKYLRLFLRARAGDQIDVATTSIPEASAVNFSGPSEWQGDEGANLLQGLLAGRPVCSGQKVAVPTYAGTTIMFEVQSTEPDGLVRIGPSSHLCVQRIQKPTSEPGGTTYQDIGGLSREIQRLRELVEFPLRSPEVFARLGIEAPRGVILYGPPGTGKTLIAKALSNEVGAQFFSIQGPEIVSSFYGESERKLREIFERARDRAPSVVLIDEIDAVAPKREQTQGELERRLVATLLTLMDGLTDLKRVVVIGTTNRVNSLDPALRRPGRFEHELNVGVPDKRGRREILRIHTRRMPLARDVDLEFLAERTPGFVGADLAALCREAGYCALRRVCPQEELEKGHVFVDADVQIQASDFGLALSGVKPSAVREVSVQISRDVSWESIGGLDGAKREVVENVVFGLQKPKAFASMGIRPAKGLLLYGPPGTGKTLIAKAVASQCEANFIAVRGPEVRSKWFGESEEKIRFIFSKAREVAPSVVFFDEIDAIAPARGREASGLTDSLVNQLLTEMDGLEPLESVFVIAATNRSELLDPALLRPGRFDLQILISLPDGVARQSIFRIHLRRTPLADDVDFNGLAELADGLSGADIAEVCRQAAVRALREAAFAEAGISVNMRHLVEALEEVKGTQERLRPRPVGFHAFAKKADES